MFLLVHFWVPMMYFESSVVNHSEWFQPKSVLAKLLSMLPGQIDCMDWEVEGEKISRQLGRGHDDSDTLKHPGPAKSKTFMTRPAYEDLEANALTELPPVQGVFLELPLQRMPMACSLPSRWTEPRNGLMAYGPSEKPSFWSWSFFGAHVNQTGQGMEAASAASWSAPALAVPDLGSRNHARLWGDAPEKIPWTSGLHTRSRFAYLFGVLKCA